MRVMGQIRGQRQPCVLLEAETVGGEQVMAAALDHAHRRGASAVALGMKIRRVGATEVHVTRPGEDTPWLHVWAEESPAPASAADRQRSSRDRRRESGWVRVEVWVPRKRADEVRAYARGMVDG